MRRHHQYPETAAENSACTDGAHHRALLQCAVLRRVLPIARLRPWDSTPSRQLTAGPIPDHSGASRRRHPDHHHPEIECPNWIEEPALAAGFDSVHWLALGGPAVAATE